MGPTPGVKTPITPDEPDVFDGDGGAQRLLVLVPWLVICSILGGTWYPLATIGISG
jgi:hypothetical protein